MTCLNCGAENTRDYPLCHNCENTCHFTNRENCRRIVCEDARDFATLPAALRERFRDMVLIATSDDPPGRVTVPFGFEALKPEARLEIARGLSEMVRGSKLLGNTGSCDKPYQSEPAR
jgi:hypothetical protein